MKRKATNRPRREKRSRPVAEVLPITIVTGEWADPDPALMASLRDALVKHGLVLQRWDIAATTEALTLSVTRLDAADVRRELELWPEYTLTEVRIAPAGDDPNGEVGDIVEPPRFSALGGPAKNVETKGDQT
ncbi:MAG: hypothetical protein ACREMF_11950 [Gemmatimonadales bacterium]